jgi:hypothetical protein
VLVLSTVKIYVGNLLKMAATCSAFCYCLSKKHSYCNIQLLLNVFKFLFLCIFRTSSINRMEDSTPSGFSWLTYKAKWRCGVELGMVHVFLFKFNLF